MGYGFQNRNSVECPARHPVNGTDTLKEGYALCLDFDNATTGTAPEWDRRVHQCEKPTLQNLRYFLGVIHPMHVGNANDVADSVKEFNIIRASEGKTPGVNVWTNLNVAVGEFLAPMPGSYAFGAPVCHPPVFRCIEAADRSSTAGLVMGEFGIIQPIAGELESQIMSVWNDFVGAAEPSATDDLTAWLLEGTNTPVAALIDEQNGVLRLTTGGTSGNESSIQLNNECVSLASGNQVYFKARVKFGSYVATSGDISGIIGFALQLTSVYNATTTSANWVAFTVETAAVSGGGTGATPSANILASLGKDATFTNVDTGVDIDNGWHTYEIVIDRPNAQVLFYIDGVLVVTQTTLTNLPDDELLTPVVEVETIETATATCDIDLIGFNATK